MYPICRKVDELEKEIKKSNVDFRLYLLVFELMIWLVSRYTHTTDMPTAKKKHLNGWLEFLEPNEFGSV